MGLLNVTIDILWIAIYRYGRVAKVIFSLQRLYIRCTRADLTIPMTLILMWIAKLNLLLLLFTDKSWCATPKKAIMAYAGKHDRDQLAYSCSCSVKKFITKTCLYNFEPLKPHFYIVKLGFTGVYIIFLISAQNIDCGYSLEPPRRGGSNEYPQSMFCAEIWKISEFFIRKFSFFGGKFSI